MMAAASQRARAGAITTVATLLAGVLLVTLFLPAFPLFREPQSYLQLHLLMELCTIVISLLAFAMGWTALDQDRSGAQLTLACGFLAVALIDCLHTLSFPGMPQLVTQSSTEKAIFFWLAARTVMAATLITVGLKPSLSVSRYLLLGLALSVCLITAWLGLFHAELFPRTYVEGTGLTAFKIGCEYALIAAYALAAWLLVQRANEEQGAQFWWLGCAAVIMGLGEFLFTRYVVVSDDFNFLGHLYKLIAFAIVCRVVFVAAISAPFGRLRALEHKFRASFDQAFQFMALLDVDGRILDLNQIGLAAGRVRPDEVLGRLLWDAPWAGPSPEERARIEDSVRRAARGETVSFEVSYFPTPGELHYSDYAIKPVRDEQGVITMLVGQGRDITEQKRQQEALRQTDERLQLAVEASGLGIFDHDHRTDRLYWSPELNAMYGRPPGAADTAKAYIDIVHPEDREAIIAAMTRAHDPASSGHFDIEHRVVRGNGEIRWIALRSQTTFTGTGEQRRPERTVGVVLDVTERRQREEAIEISDRRLRQAVRVSKIGIYDHDHGTGELYTSPEQRANYLFGPDEAVTLEDYVACVHEMDRAEMAAAVQRAHDPAGDGLFDVEYRIVRRDGQIRWLMTRSQSYFEGQGASRQLTHTIGAVLDVTERKQAEEELQRLNATLEQRVAERTRELDDALQTLQLAQDDLVRTEKLAALGSLVAGVAHELNTPLGNALIVASTLRDKSAQFEAEANSGALKRSSLDGYVRMSLQAADLVMHNLTQAADLVSSFKQVAVDQTSTKRRKFDLKEVVEEVLATVHHLVKTKPIHVRTDLADGIEMDSYPGPLGQVLNNLFNNVLEHAFAGRAGGEISIRTRREGQDQVLLEFRDDGAGIEPAHLPKIFDPFFTTRLGQGGSGLGLNIVHNIVTGVLGGYITVNSQLGRGTSFTLLIPVVAPRAADIPQA